MRESFRRARRVGLRFTGDLEILGADEPDIGDAIRGDAEELRNGDRFGARLRGEADGERSAAG